MQKIDLAGPARLLCAKEAAQAAGVSPWLFHKMVRLKMAPPPVHIAWRLPRWRSDALAAWLEKRAA